MFLDCIPPPPGPNGVFNIDVNSSIIPVKITVKYECHPGFSATDPTQFSCQNGKWDIELDIPNCTIPETGLLNHFKHSAVVSSFGFNFNFDAGCGNPPFLLHGDIIGDPPYDLNETISYRCLEGFEFGNSNASFISQCEPGNQCSLQIHDENFPTCLPGG